MAALHWRGFLGAWSKVQVTFHRSRAHTGHSSIDKLLSHTDFNRSNRAFFKRLGIEDIFNSVHLSVSCDLYSDLWKSDLFFRPAAFWAWSTSLHTLF